MKSHVFSIIIATLLIPYVSNACTCLPIENFCQSNTGNNREILPDVIIRAKIKEIEPTLNELSVIEVMHGIVDQNKISLESFEFCPTSFRDLEDGGEYIVALYKSGNTYVLPSCAIGALKIISGIVVGPVTEGINSIPFDKLSEINNCIFSRLQPENNITIFPNPTVDLIHIKNDNASFTFTNPEIEIFDITQKLISNQTINRDFEPGEVLTIDISDIAAGVYIVKLYGMHNDGTFKIVKQD